MNELLGTDRQMSCCARLRRLAVERMSYASFGYSAGLAGHRSEWSSLISEQPKGLYLPGNGHRAYSSSMLQRFTTSDANSPFARGGLNAYAWCLSDPVNRVDPEGAASFIYLSGAISSLLNLLKKPRNFLDRLNNFSTLMGISGAAVHSFGQPAGLVMIKTSGVIRGGVLMYRNRSAIGNALRHPVSTLHQAGRNAVAMVANSIPYPFEGWRGDQMIVSLEIV